MSSFLRSVSDDFGFRARKKRAKLFRERFSLDRTTRILDLGSHQGENIHMILEGADIEPENVFIADIDNESLIKGAKKYGYTPVLVNESAPLPFPDGFFDIVFSSSVLEHVTVPKSKVWEIYSGRIFTEKAIIRQKEYANEIKRLGKQYFVQTPYKYFPIESHTLLPLVWLLPRYALLPFLRITNKFWIKSTSPDWHLLNKADLIRLFGEVELLEEKMFGLTKSIMAVRVNSPPNGL
jgi:SAM-dependent methyltransferase